MTTYLVLRDSTTQPWYFWVNQAGSLSRDSTVSPTPLTAPFDAFSLTDSLSQLWYITVLTDGQLKVDSVVPAGAIRALGLHISLLNVLGDRYRFSVLPTEELQLLLASTRGDIMPDTFELSLSLLKNGKPYPGLSPFTKRLTVDQVQDFDEILEAGSGDVTLPIGQVNELSFLVLQGNQSQLLKLGNIRLGAGGVIVLWNAQNSTDTLNNDSALDARNIGVAGGS